MIFGRPDTSCDKVLDDWITGTDEAARAIAINLRYDVRVSSRRQEAFDGLVQRPLSTETFRDGIKTYKRERIQVQLTPDFVVGERNAENIISPGSGPVRLNPYTYLVQILDLTGLYKVLQWGKVRYPALAGFWDVGGEAACAAWWGMMRRGRRADEIDVYVKATLEALGAYSWSSQYQPTWVTTWASFQSLLAEEGDQWMEFLGIPLRSVPRWLVVLKYRAKRAGTIACPTQLDAGYFECFFPTPVRRNDGHKVRSGHAMQIGGKPSLLLPPEYIHCQIPYQETDFVACKSTSVVTSVGLPGSRHRHYDAMTVKYGSLVRSWMPSCW